MFYAALVCFGLLVGLMLGFGIGCVVTEWQHAKWMSGPQACVKPLRRCRPRNATRFGTACKHTPSPSPARRDGDKWGVVLRAASESVPPDGVTPPE